MIYDSISSPRNKNVGTYTKNITNHNQLLTISLEILLKNSNQSTKKKVLLNLKLPSKHHQLFFPTQQNFYEPPY